MGKVTSKLQITIPKRIAEQYGIAPGDEIEFVPAGDVIRLVPLRAPSVIPKASLEERIRRFDAFMASEREYEKQLRVTGPPPAKRDWKREDLYVRGKFLTEPDLEEPEPD